MDLICKCGHAKEAHPYLPDDICNGCWKELVDKYGPNKIIDITFTCRSFDPDNLKYLEAKYIRKLVK